MKLVKISKTKIVNIENGTAYERTEATQYSKSSVLLSSVIVPGEGSPYVAYGKDEVITLWNHLCSLANDLTQPAAQVEEEDETIKVGDFVEFVCNVTKDMLYASSSSKKLLFKSGDTCEILELDPIDNVRPYAIEVNDTVNTVGKFWIRSEWIKKVQS